MAGNNFLSIDSAVFYRCNKKFFDRLLAEYGIVYTQFVLLTQIYENDGSSMNDLAKMGSYDKGTITKSLQKLEQLGYVKIENSLVDKRSKVLHVTQSGRDLMPRLYNQKQEWYNYLTEGLSEREYNEFARIFGRIVARAQNSDLTAISSDELSFCELKRFELNDYPGEVAAVLYVGGCNYRCPFCPYTPYVFLKEDAAKISSETALEYLKERQQLLSGLVIRGGEPLLQRGLESFLEEVKQLGLKVKIVTNGSNYQLLKRLIDKGLLTYVQLQLANDFTHYARTIGIASFDTGSVRKCLALLKEERVDYEVSMLFTAQYHYDTSYKELIRMLRGCKRLRMKNFVAGSPALSEGIEPLAGEQFELIAEQLRSYVKEVLVEQDV